MGKQGTGVIVDKWTSRPVEGLLENRETGGQGGR